MSGREFIRMSGRELDYHYANYQIEKKKRKTKPKNCCLWENVFRGVIGVISWVIKIRPNYDH